MRRPEMPATGCAESSDHARSLQHKYGDFLAQRKAVKAIRTRAITLFLQSGYSERRGHRPTPTWVRVAPFVLVEPIRGTRGFRGLGILALATPCRVKRQFSMTVCRLATAPCCGNSTCHLRGLSGLLPRPAQSCLRGADWDCRRSARPMMRHATEDSDRRRVGPVGSCNRSDWPQVDNAAGLSRPFGDSNLRDYRPVVGRSESASRDTAEDPHLRGTSAKHGPRDHKKTWPGNDLGKPSDRPCSSLFRSEIRTAWRRCFRNDAHNRLLVDPYGSVTPIKRLSLAGRRPMTPTFTSPYSPLVVVLSGVTAWSAVSAVAETDGCRPRLNSSSPPNCSFATC